MTSQSYVIQTTRLCGIIDLFLWQIYSTRSDWSLNGLDLCHGKNTMISYCWLLYTFDKRFVILRKIKNIQFFLRRNVHGKVTHMKSTRSALRLMLPCNATINSYLVFIRENSLRVAAKASNQTKEKEDKCHFFRSLCRLIKGTSNATKLRRG